MGTMNKIPDDELLKMAVEFDLGPEPLLGGHPFWWERYRDSVRLHAVSVKNVGSHNDGPDRWAIRSVHGCLNKSGEWEYEGMPSSRDDDFYRRCRYDSVHEAVLYYRRWHAAVVRYAVARYKEVGVTITDNLPLDVYKSVIVNYDEIPAEKFGPETKG
jgi:hypothetical protein